jgi:hypothetical protein
LCGAILWACIRFVNRQEIPGNNSGSASRDLPGNLRYAVSSRSR